VVVALARCLAPWCATGVPRSPAREASPSRPQTFSLRRRDDALSRRCTQFNELPPVLARRADFGGGGHRGGHASRMSLSDGQGAATWVIEVGKWAIRMVDPARAEGANMMLRFIEGRNIRSSACGHAGCDVSLPVALAHDGCR